MKKEHLNKVWIAALLVAGPCIVNAQQLAALPAGPPPLRPNAGMPGPPKPGDKGHKPEPEMQKLVTLSGTIGKPVANNRFEYDALLLKTADNEVLVKFPPHLGEQLVGKREGAAGKFTGFYRTNPEGKKEFRMVSADINGQTITDAPPAPPKDSLPQQQQKVITSVIKSLNYTPKKEVNGFVLSSGEYVNIPPHIGRQLAGQLKTGEKVVVNGFIEPKRRGVVYSEDITSVKAQTLTLNGQAYLVR